MLYGDAFTGFFGSQRESDDDVGPIHRAANDRLARHDQSVEHTINRGGHAKFLDLGWRNVTWVGPECNLFNTSCVVFWLLDTAPRQFDHEIISIAAVAAARELHDPAVLE